MKWYFSQNYKLEPQTLQQEIIWLEHMLELEVSIEN